MIRKTLLVVGLVGASIVSTGTASAQVFYRPVVVGRPVVAPVARAVAYPVARAVNVVQAVRPRVYAPAYRAPVYAAPVYRAPVYGYGAPGISVGVNVGGPGVYYGY